MRRRLVMVDNRGRVVIPAEIRSSFGMELEMRVCVTLKGACIALEAVSEGLVDKTRGMFKGEPSLSAALKRWRHNESEC